MSETPNPTHHIELVHLQSTHHEHDVSETNINITNTSRMKYLAFGRGGHSLIDVTYDQDILSYNIYTKNKWCILFANIHFWTRCFTFILSLILLTLSISYCISEISETKLNLIKHCVPKTNSQIWQHSYESTLKHNNNQDIMTRESQYGHSSDSCWTNKQYEINSDQLWYSNKHMNEWKQSIVYNYKFCLFSFIAVYALIIIFYNIITLIMDLIYILKGTIHEKSIEYKLTTKRNLIQKQKRINMCESFFNKYYLRYVGADTTAWIIKQFITEIISISIQFQALLLYNGYHMFDLNNTDNIYIAIKSEYIILLTIVIAFNCFMDGFLWLFYAFTPKYCKGALFQSLLFFIDNISYLLYILFPFVVVLTDEYNTHTHNIRVLLGELNINSILIFISIFIPLLLLCNQCLFMLINSINQLRNKYYYSWKSTQDENVLTLQTTIQRKSSWIESNHDRKCQKYNQFIILLISIFYITFSICLLVFVTQYINNSKKYCNCIKEQNYFLDSDHSTIYLTLSNEEKQTLQQNPELFVWDSCIYKVYPFINDNKYKCQCRVFVIDWNSDIISTPNQRLNFNITQQQILNSMLTHWHMLQKFKTSGDIDINNHNFIFKSSMFNALYMTAFEWNDKHFHIIENGISKWSNLQYLKLESNGITKLPNDFYKLNQMRYLIFIQTGLTHFDEQICNLTQLLLLEMQREFKIETIPHCISNLKLLNALFIDSSYELINIPLSIFNLPNVFELSFYNGNINYNNLLSYNLPNNISINNTYAINKYFDDTFYWNNNTNYWLVFNPICNNINNISLPIKLQSFMNANVKCNHLCSDNTQTTLCIPRNVGNGKCDAACNTNNCFYDYGDCVQLCFANSDLSNCSWEKFSNNICDKGCDNEYCTGYYYDSFFTEPIVYSELPGIADLNQCENNITFI
eukprot:167505_1